jgi:hypothetical protein
VHADQHVLAVADVSLDERDVRFLVEAALERGDRNSPCSVGSAAVAIRRTSASVRIRY